MKVFQSIKYIGVQRVSQRWWRWCRRYNLRGRWVHLHHSIPLVLLRVLSLVVRIVWLNETILLLWIGNVARRVVVRRLIVRLLKLVHALILL